MSSMNRVHDESARGWRLLARVRHKQLLLAMNGKIEESARYAQLACRVRRQLCQPALCA